MRRAVTLAVIALTMPALAACGSVREAVVGPRMGPMACGAPSSRCRRASAARHIASLESSKGTKGGGPAAVRGKAGT